MAETGQDGLLKNELGRIKSHPDIHDGRPHIHRKFIDVLSVLDMLSEGKSDAEICRRIPTLSRGDIDACRAYQARFLVETLSHNFNVRADDRPFFMLDENISYFLLSDVVRIFGRSSHVFADGLYGDNNDDEACIWAHMVEEGYQAILTTDNDFKRISRLYRHNLAEALGSTHGYEPHIPAVIGVAAGMNHRQIAGLLGRYQDQIRDFVGQKCVLMAELTDNGLILPPYAPLRGHPAWQEELSP